MIDRVFAKKFIENIRGYADYNFIIINPDGIIIAATEKEREGVFHEASYLMMKNRDSIATVEIEDIPRYLGVKCGIDMPIFYKNEVVGAIGITGIPNEVRQIVLIAKMSIETMLEYEMYKEELTARRNSSERFWNLLLNGEKRHAEELLHLMRQSGYSTRRQRVAVMFSVSGQNDEFAVFEELTGSGILYGEDIPVFTEDKEIIVFKSLSCPPERLFCEYKDEIQNFVVAVRRFFKTIQVTARCVVGSAQDKVENYFYAYQHCRWMEQHKHNTPFFYDYVSEYIFDSMPHTILSGVFGVTDSVMDAQTRDMFMPLMEALKETNYNLNGASAKLYIHRNTLVFRYNKIKNQFGIQPLQNSGDKDFAEVLYYYLSRETRQADSIKPGGKNKTEKSGKA